LGRAGNRDREWAQAEFSSAELGDKRRTVRLVELAQRLSERPEMSLPQALEHTAALKAAYRFFDNADIAHESVLAPHVLSSIGRMRARPVVLAVQDTSYLDYATHPATEALGPLSGEGGHGMIMHSTFAVTPERLPLGVLSLRLWARDAAKPMQRQTRRTRAIKDKESHKWIESVQAVAALKERLPGTRLVSVADRESDVFEFFAEARKLGVDVLARAAYDRNVDGEHEQVFATLASAPVVAHKYLALAATPKRKARTAKLEIRACPLVLHAPRNGTARGLPPLALWGVWAYEPEAPQGVEPLDWKLLSSVPVITAEDALERLEWYAARWSIEQWHKILKDGCRIEMRQLQSAERLMRLITVYAVIAWRIFYATLLARLVPDMSCTAILQQEEWEALYCRIHQTPIPVATPPPLRQCVRWIARLGGFLGRRADGEPGSKTLWRGFQHLIAMTEMYRIMKPHMPATLPVSKDVGND
jgi:transposase-like protein/transposase Tn5 family protein